MSVQGSSDSPGMMAGALEKVMGVARQHPNYATVGAIAAGVTVFALVLIMSGSVAGGLAGGPMLLIPGVIIGLGGALLLARILSKNPKYERIARIISAIVIPLAIAVVGFSMVNTGVLSAFFPYGLVILCAIPFVVGTYSYPMLQQELRARKSRTTRRHTPPKLDSEKKSKATREEEEFHDKGKPRRNATVTHDGSNVRIDDSETGKID